MNINYHTCATPMAMAEVVGFEPANDGVKVRCVTISPYLIAGPSGETRTRGLLIPNQAL